MDGPVFLYSGGEMQLSDTGPEDCYKQCQKQGLTKVAAKMGVDLVVGIMAQKHCLCGFDSATYFSTSSPSM